MSPDEQYRRVDGLLKSFGDHEGRLGRIDAEIENLERLMERGMVEVTRLMAAVQTSCDGTASRLERAIREQEEKTNKRFETLARQQEARKWSRSQWLTVVSGIVIPTACFVLLLLGVGPS